MGARDRGVWFTRKNDRVRWAFDGGISGTVSTRKRRRFHARANGLHSRCATPRPRAVPVTSSRSRKREIGRRIAHGQTEGGLALGYLTTKGTGRDAGQGNVQDKAQGRPAEEQADSSQHLSKRRGRALRPKGRRAGRPAPATRRRDLGGSMTRTASSASRGRSRWQAGPQASRDARTHAEPPPPHGTRFPSRPGVPDSSARYRVGNPRASRCRWPGPSPRGTPAGYAGT